MSNEVLEQFFQIEPSGTTGSSGRCQFMNDCYNIEDIQYVSAVEMIGVQLYQFRVKLHNVTKEFEYKFSTKATALRAQRKLARVYTGLDKREDHASKTDSNTTER